MRTPRLLGSTLALTGLLLATAAQADVKVGVTAAVNPQAIGQPPTEPERMLLVGSDNFANEKITTGPEGQAQLLFIDGSSISVGPSANLTIDEYVYDSNTKTGKFAITAAQGAFRLVGGAISKTNEIVITTPTATAGIRGGIANIDTRPGEPMHAQFLFGKSLRVTAQNVTQEATRPGFEIVVTPGQPPGSPIRMTTAEVRGSFSQFQGRTKTSGSGQPGQMGQAGQAGGEPAQDAALSQSGFSSASGSSQAPQSLTTVGSLNNGFGNILNPNTQNLLNNIVDQAAASNLTNALAASILYGHFYCCNPFSSFDYSSLASTPNTTNNFTFSAQISGNTVSFTLPVGGNGNQNFSFPFTPGVMSSFSNLALIGGGSINGTVQVSPDNTFFGIFGQVTPGGANDCGGKSNCKFGLFAGVPTSTSQGTGLPTSGVSTYNIATPFENIPFVSNLNGNNSNGALLSNVGGAGTAISPMFVRWSPVTNPAATVNNDQRATLMQASLVISGTGANQQSGLFGATGAFFQEANSTVAMGGGVVGYALSCATCPSVRVSGGIASAQISTPDGLGNAIFGPNAETIVAVPDKLIASPNNPNVRQPSQQIQVPFGTPASQQAGNGNFFINVLTQNAATSSPTQFAANGSQTSQTLVGYTGGGINTTSGTSPSGFGGTGGPNVSITTDASTNRVQASFTVVDALNAKTYGLQFGSTSGFNDGRSAFITDQVFAARDAVTNSGGPTSTINGSTANFSNMFMVSAATVPIDFQSFAGPGVTACTCSFMQWGWWIGEVDPTSAQNRFLGTWVAGNMPLASQIPSVGSATYSGHAIATVSSGVGQYIAAGNYTQSWSFASASGTATISKFDVGGALNPGPSGITFTGAVSAPGGVGNQVNFTGGLAGSGVAAGVNGAIAGSFYQNPKIGDPVAGVGGSFAVSGGSYKAAGTFAACRGGPGC